MGKPQVSGTHRTQILVVHDELAAAATARAATAGAATAKAATAGAATVRGCSHQHPVLSRRRRETREGRAGRGGGEHRQQIEAGAAPQVAGGREADRRPAVGGAFPRGGPVHADQLVRADPVIRSGVLALATGGDGGAGRGTVGRPRPLSRRGMLRRRRRARADAAARCHRLLLLLPLPPSSRRRSARTEFRLGCVL